MVRPGVGVELVGYPQPSQLRIELLHIFLGRVGVNLPEVEQDRTLDPLRHLERRLLARAPYHHDIAPIVGHGGLEVGVRGRCQPGHPTAHAEAGDSQPFSVNRRMRPQKVHRGADVRHNLRVAQVLYGPGTVRQHIVRYPVVKLRRAGRVARACQPVRYVPDELVNAAPVLAHHHAGERACSIGQAQVRPHFRAVYLEGLPRRCHDCASLPGT